MLLLAEFDAVVEQGIILSTREFAIGGSEGFLIIALQLELRRLAPVYIHGGAIEIEAGGRGEILLGNLLLGDVATNGFGLRLLLGQGDDVGHDGLRLLLFEFLFLLGEESLLLLLLLLLLSEESLLLFLLFLLLG